MNLPHHTNDATIDAAGGGLAAALPTPMSATEAATYQRLRSHLTVLKLGASAELRGEAQLGLVLVWGVVGGVEAGEQGVEAVFELSVLV